MVCDSRVSQACSHRVDEWFSQDGGERHRTWKSISVSVSMALTQTKKAYLIMQCTSQMQNVGFNFKWRLRIRRIKGRENGYLRIT